MTGQELIDWIKSNNLEDKEFGYNLVSDDFRVSYPIFKTLTPDDFYIHKNKVVEIVSS